MNGITIKLLIEAPELSAAINHFADALNSHPLNVPTAPVTVPAASDEQTPALAEKPVEAPVKAPENVTPINAPVTDAVNGGASAPTNAPAPATDTAPAPATGATSEPAPAPVPAPAEKVYTFDDITNAGAQLLEAGKMSDLMKLLKDGYGVQAVTQLKPEQYAAVAADLRKLGANI